ncbi:hypothetical protein KJ762_13140 [bacterium]|nr:hypothetical protein [bacterium]MBU1635436.1 hypothetical protein [bacterium]
MKHRTKSIFHRNIVLLHQVIIILHRQSNTFHRLIDILLHYTVLSHQVVETWFSERRIEHHSIGFLFPAIGMVPRKSRRRFCAGEPTVSIIRNHCQRTESA